MTSSSSNTTRYKEEEAVERRPNSSEITCRRTSISNGITATWIRARAARAAAEDAIAAHRAAGVKALRSNDGTVQASPKKRKGAGTLDEWCKREGIDRELLIGDSQSQARRFEHSAER